MANPASVASDVLRALASAGRVSKEQVDKAKSELQARGGLPWTHLVTAGVPPADVLNALAQVTQIPAASVDRLRKANRATAQGLDGATCWRLLAAPFASDNGVLEVAFADPRLLDEARDLLPPHRPYLALEAHVRTMLSGLFPAGAGPTSKPIPLNELAAAPTPGRTTATVPAGEQRPAEMIGSYKIERRLGEGGMASVFFAREVTTQKPVAVKVMKDHLTNDPTFVQRFAHEARATVGMRHENIVEVLSYGDEAGRYFMACEFIDGGTVDELLTKLGKLPAPLAAEIFAQMMSGLSFAHGKNIVHRDLKPANLLLSSRGSVKVSDFGIAKTEGGAALTQTGLLIGTAAYMSPEQAQGQPVDTRSDLFTAGIILWQLLSGHNPFDAESPTTSIVRIISGGYPLVRELVATVPSALEAIIERLMQKDPAARYQSAAEVLADLEPYLQEVRRKYPTLLSEAVTRPEETKLRLLRGEADEQLREARPLLEGSQADRARGTLLLYRASLLAPDNAEIAQLLSASIQRDGFRFGPSTSPKILELEKILAETPDAPGPLQQAAQLYRMEGNLERSLIYLKRYLRVRPRDGYAATQLSQLTGDKVKVITGPSPAPKTTGATAQRTGSNPAFRTGGAAAPAPAATGTAGLVAGIKTGGFNAQAPSSGSGGVVAPGAKPTDPPPEGVTFYVDGADAPEPQWRRQLKRVAPYALGVLALILGVRMLMKFVDSATKETEEKTWELREKLAAQGPGKMANQIKQIGEQQLRETGESELRGARKLRQNIEMAMDESRFQDAIGQAQMLINDYPQSSDAEMARIAMVNAYVKLGMREEALSNINAYVTQYPQGMHYAEAIIRRGELTLQSGQPRQAIGDFTEVIKNYDTSPFAAEAMMLRGITRKELGEKEDAAADLRVAVSRTAPGTPVHVRASEELRGLGE